MANANGLTIAGATASSNPTLTAVGSDSNIGVNVVPKGTGVFLINGIKVNEYFTHSWAIPAGATAADYDGCFWIADVACELVSVVERHLVAGSDGGAVTLMLKKVPSGTAPGSGTDMLSAGINLKGTANTNASGTLHGTPANYQMAAGDAVALVTTGTLTAVDGVTVTARFKRI